MESVHVAQVKYYIYKLSQKGIPGVKGVLEYPKLKQREEVLFTEADQAEIPLWENEAHRIIDLENCPERINAKICKNCSYYDFCYSTE